MSSGILCSLLLIPLISTVNGDVTLANEGQSITVTCQFRERNITDKANIHVFWKKETGEKVAWKITGDNTKAFAFNNRTIDIIKNLSLVINECKTSDQGVYILCIDGKPSCNVRLLVAEKQNVIHKSFTDTRQEKQNSPHKSFTDTTQDSNNENGMETIYRCRLFMFIGFGVFMSFLVMASVLIKRNNRHSGFSPACTEVHSI